METVKTFDMYKVYGIDIFQNKTELAVVGTKEDAKRIKDYFINIFDKIKIEKDLHLEDKPRKIIVIGDSNNSVNEVEQLLNSTKFYHNLEQENTVEQLIFLGNMFGERPGFLEYVDFLMNLYKTNEVLGKKLPVIFLRGVNEYHLINYIQDRYYDLPKFMLPIIYNIERELGYPIRRLPIENGDIWEFLLRTIKFYENDKYIFIPSYIRQTMDWKTTPDEEFYSFDPRFVVDRNHTCKTIIFGNVPAQLITGKRYTKAWINNDKNKVCLNGNPTEKEGKVLGLYIDEEEFHHISAKVRNRA